MLSPPAAAPLPSRATMPAMKTSLPTTSPLDQVWGGGSGTCGLEMRRFFMARLLSGRTRRPRRAGLLRERTAVDDELAPRHVRRVIGREKEHGRHDLVDRAEPAERH